MFFGAILFGLSDVLRFTIANNTQCMFLNRKFYKHSKFWWSGVAQIFVNISGSYTQVEELWAVHRPFSKYEASWEFSFIVCDSKMRQVLSGHPVLTSNESKWC